MSDTLQIVRWALERPCLFRTGEDWFLPAVTGAQLAELRTVARAEPDGRVVDGICVTSYTAADDDAGRSHRIPYSGFPIETALARFGGLAGAAEVCGACEANCGGDSPIRVAGCFGWLDVWPDSKELDADLRQVIEDRGLEERLRRAFPVTDPIWYGFWIDSPLRHPQAELLLELLGAVAEDEDRGERSGVDAFLAALKAVIAWELPLHVALAPPGHVDLGWVTTFPHCPRCKAAAPLKRWQATYPTTACSCAVCGNVFSPNETHHSEPENFDGTSNSLEKQLGVAAFDCFVKRFLIHQGCSETQAEEVLDRHRNGPLLRQIAAVRRKRHATLRSLRSAAVRKRVPRLELSPVHSFALAEDVPLELVPVPAGAFRMGSAPDDEQGGKNERPQHAVRIEQPILMGRFPVTQAQWQAIMDGNPSRHRGDPDLPVENISWFAAQEFCERLCERLRRPFRLPSEAEWEYACRAGTTTVYAFGDVLLPDQATFTPARSLSSVLGDPIDEDRRTTPVGSNPPNRWGLYDMHGNVEEWCEDVWHEDYAGAPEDGRAWLDGEDTTPLRVVRGGWSSATEFVCRSASRQLLRADAGKDGTEVEEETSLENDDLLGLLLASGPSVGFRVVCEIV